MKKKNDAQSNKTVLQVRKHPTNEWPVSKGSANQQLGALTVSGSPPTWQASTTCHVSQRGGHGLNDTF
jgi:hypothetical protein